MDGYVRIGTELDTKDFSAEIKYIESQLREIEQKLKQADMGFEVGDTEKLQAQYSKLIKQLDKLIKKQVDLNKTDLTQIEKNVDKVGNSVSKTISKVGKWALAVFGVRSAYMFVRQSASTLAQYNEQIATDLEYIQFALASMLQPVIEGLINLAYKLLTYVNYIAKAWFGIDLFANASAKAMEKGSKSAEKMKKSLAGFDEMNVLNENGTTGAMGGIPSMDLSEPKDIPIPKWIQWIADNKEIVIGGLIGIASGLTAIELILKGGTFAKFGKVLAGITLIILGLAIGINGLSEYIKLFDKGLQDSGKGWEAFGKILIGIGLIIAGLGVAIFGLPVIIAGAVVSALGVMAMFWDEIQSGVNKALNWLEKAFKFLFGETIGDIIFSPIREAVEMSLSVFGGLFKGVKQILDGILTIFKVGFKEGIILVGKGIVNTLIGLLNGLIGSMNVFLTPFRSIIVLIGKAMGKNITMGNVKLPKVPYLKTGGIVNMPGRGVPIGGAIAGEVSKEGVIPLTDAQAMQELGQTIGRYITINANITNTMNGRVISREIKKINANNDFATNS